MSTTLTPNLMSENVNESVLFYRDRLGFHYLAGVLSEGDAMAAEFSADAPLQWAMLGREEARVMFQLRGSLAREYDPAADMPLGASASLVRCPTVTRRQRSLRRRILRDWMALDGVARTALRALIGCSQPVR